MPKPSESLSSILPPLICGTGTFNTQYNPSTDAIPTNAIIARALYTGVRAFDTSPYYGPSELLLGTALAQPAITDHFPRESYMLLTKVGRIALDEFDYSPEWVRASVARSLERLKTSYLDLVYCHDVEFVSPGEVLAAVQELRRIRDEEGTLRYIGVSGYPVATLCDIAELVLRETGEPLDAVQSYANFTLQNMLLASEGLRRLEGAGVGVVPNASVLGMGLLRREGVPEGGQGDWHPAPQGLRAAVQEASRWLMTEGDKIEKVAIRFAVEGWMSQGASVGSRGDPARGDASIQVDVRAKSGENTKTDDEEKVSEKAPRIKPGPASRPRLGVSVIGVSNIPELDETMRVWRSILDTQQSREDEQSEPGALSDALKSSQPSKSSEPTNASDAKAEGIEEDLAWGLKRRDEVQKRADGVRAVLGEWYNFAWESPGEGFVNMRGKKSV